MRAAPRLSPGDRATPRRIGPITQTDIVRFAGAGGDFNPLHHDPEHARAAGFPTVIAMGQFTAGILAGLLTDWVGVENLREFEVRFVSPVYLGDTVEATAEVIGVTAEGASIEAFVHQGERVVVKATATVASSQGAA